MKIITFLLIILFTSSFYALSNTLDCNKFDKLSTEYAKCTSELIKKKSIEIKDKTASKLEKTKKKFNKSDLKKKLSIFKNSKTHKEFIENLKNEN